MKSHLQIKCYFTREDTKWNFLLLSRKLINWFKNQLIMICVFVGHILYMLFSLLVNYFFSDSNFCKGKLIFACLNFEDFYSRVFNFPAKLSTS